MRVTHNGGVFSVQVTVPNVWIFLYGYGGSSFAGFCGISCWRVGWQSCGTSWTASLAFGLSSSLFWCICFCLTSMSLLWSSHIRRPVPSLSRRVAGFDFFLFWVALCRFFFIGRYHAVFVKDLQMLFGIGNVTVDVVRVNLSFTSRRKWLPL